GRGRYDGWVSWVSSLRDGAPAGTCPVRGPLDPRTDGGGNPPDVPRMLPGTWCSASPRPSRNGHGGRRGEECPGGRSRRRVTARGPGCPQGVAPPGGGTRAPSSGPAIVATRVA